MGKSTQLHFGVIEVPYTNNKRAINTGDVAEILEGKYHIFGHFWKKYEGQITDEIKHSVEGALQSALMGAPAQHDPFGSAMGQVEALFHTFITNKEMDQLGVPGVPTMASLQGISHRFKKKKGSPGRPSFVDTGLFLTSMRAWVTK